MLTLTGLSTKNWIEKKRYRELNGKFRNRCDFTLAVCNKKLNMLLTEKFRLVACVGSVLDVPTNAMSI